MINKFKKWLVFIFMLSFIVLFLFSNIMNITVTVSQVSGGVVNNKVGNIMMQEFSLLVNIIIVVLAVLLLISIYTAVKELGHNKFTDKLSLGPSLLMKEPASVFADTAARNSKGTYQSSFENYKKYHLAGKRAFAGTMAAIIIQIFIFGYIIYNFTQLRDYQSMEKQDQQYSNQFKIQEIKQ